MLPEQVTDLQLQATWKNSQEKSENYFNTTNFKAAGYTSVW